MIQQGWTAVSGRSAAVGRPDGRLGKAVMGEEDDWLDWKAAQEILESWLGIG